MQRLQPPAEAVNDMIRRLLAAPAQNSLIPCVICLYEEETVSRSEVLSGCT